MSSVKLTNIIQVKTKDELYKVVEELCSYINHEYIVDLNKIAPEPYCLTQLKNFSDKEMFALAANAISDMLDIEGRALTKEEVRDAMNRIRERDGLTRKAFIEKVIKGSCNYGIVYDLYKNNSYNYVSTASLLALTALAKEEVTHEYYWRKTFWGFSTGNPKVIIDEKNKQIRWIADGVISGRLTDMIGGKIGIRLVRMFSSYI